MTARRRYDDELDSRLQLDADSRQFLIKVFQNRGVNNDTPGRKCTGANRMYALVTGLEPKQFRLLTVGFGIAPNLLVPTHALAYRWAPAGYCVAQITAGGELHPAPRTTAVCEPADRQQQ